MVVRARNNAIPGRETIEVAGHRTLAEDSEVSGSAVSLRCVMRNLYSSLENRSKNIDAIYLYGRQIRAEYSMNTQRA